MGAPFMSPLLQVIKPGQLSLIQDFGRFGLSHIGVTQSGPIDDYAYSWANHLLGNRINLATLEITLGQAEFHVKHPCMLAIAGGDLSATLDGKLIGNWQSFSAQAGQTLKFGLAKNGLRAYLAVRGGFIVPHHLGSVATVPKEQLGGLTQNGVPLQTGDSLYFNPHAIDNKPVHITFRYKPDYNLPLKLRVIEGYQALQFSSQQLDRFYQTSFTVSQHADRMGYRLNGDTVTPPATPILSEGIALGAIQIPPDGQPIILLNDRQTIGGYPKLGCVARIDLPRLAQAKPGQSIRFIKGDLHGLQEVWCQWALYFGY
ncbi:allophanate hydrolase [Vibrio anguillarum]|nr:allophanate hydrolase [Vibrio anguillarum]